MKKRFMILPPFLVIFTIYGALTDVSAATEGTTGITETTLQEPILNEQPPGIPLPEAVMEANGANIPETTTTESPPAEVTVVDEQMTEKHLHHLQNSLCRKRPIRNPPQKQPHQRPRLLRKQSTQHRPQRKQLLQIRLHP